MLRLGVLIGVLLSTSAIADPVVPDFTLKVVKTKLDAQSGWLVITPPAGHHFNLKTPQSAWQKNVKLKEVTAQESQVFYELIDASISSTDQNSIIKAKAFLCDDAKSYCVKKTLEVPMSALPQGVGQLPKKISHLKSLNLKEPNKTSRSSWLSDEKKAFELAKKLNKKVLIDFFGIWCPPCNMLDSFVFSSSEFKEAAQEFVLLKLDADSEKSWNLKEKYQVSGYPTLVITDSQGKEISRRVGFLELPQFLTFMKAEPTPSASPGAAMIPVAESSQKSWKSNWDQQAELFFTSKEEEVKKTVAQKMLESIDEMPESKLSALEQADVYSTAAQVIGQYGNKEEAKSWWAKAAASYEKLGEERGVNLEKAYAYAQSGEVQKATHIYKVNQSRYPKEFTFYYNHGRMMQDLKDHAQALKLGQSALKYSYGDNKLRAVHLVAGAYHELGKSPLALKLLDQTLKGVVRPSDAKNRTHRYIKQLEDLKTKIAAPDKSNVTQTAK